MPLAPGQIRKIASDCGFELCGIAPADPPQDFARYHDWVQQGHAGEMRYLTDRRAEVRRDVRNLLPNARSVICVGKLYNQQCEPPQPGSAIISRYAWGQDYHDLMRSLLDHMARQLKQHADFDFKVCVDTAPLLERTFARLAGLGWIGKNTCLINEPLGSWFFLGELVTSLDLAPAEPKPDRCGTCTRCIDACPTSAFVPAADSWAIDARLCISYFTIELRGSIPEQHRPQLGAHVFGCDICQDVCPWNSRAPVTDSFEDLHQAPDLETCAGLTESEFNQVFHESPLARPKYTGFLRNVAVAMGNSGLPRFREPLQRLAQHADPVVSEHATWALHQMGTT